MPTATLRRVCSLGLLLGIFAPAEGLAAARMLRVAEADLRGAKDVGPFLAAARVREATLTACLKDSTALDKLEQIQAFLQVSPEGSVRSASVQGAGLSDITVDVCLMEELSRTRFPEGPQAVEIVLRLRPDPVVTEEAPAEDEPAAKRGR